MGICLSVYDDFLQNLSSVLDNNVYALIIGLFCDIIVTFFAFWLALKGNSYQEKKKDNADAKQCIEDLADELNEIKNNLVELDLNNECYIDPLKTPVWDGIVLTNKIQLLAKYNQKKRKSKNTIKWYKQLFEIYGKIDEFNNWCNLLSEKNYSAIIHFGLQNDQKIRLCTDSICKSLEKIKEQLLRSSNEVVKDDISIDLLVESLRNEV